MTQHADENTRAKIDFDLSEPLGPDDTGVASDEADLDTWEKAFSGMAI